MLPGQIAKEAPKPKQVQLTGLQKDGAAKTQTSSPVNEQTAATAQGEKTKASSEESQVMHKNVPDLFCNFRFQNIEKFWEYRQLPKEVVVPDHYVKYIEPVTDISEKQNTVEKYWTYKEKNYQITEEKIQQLQEHKIDISPSDYEWVIDCWEKAAINEGQQNKFYIYKRFREKAPPEVAARVKDETLEQIFDICWKGQREARKNRSMIREFWRYMDSVGEDNYPTFKGIEEQRRQMGTRNNNKLKINNYSGNLIERENGVQLCHILMHIHEQCTLKTQEKHLEDLEFDRLIDKVQLNRPLKESDLISSRYPNDLQELDPHSQSNSLQKVQKGAMQHNKLKLIVESKRDVHPKLKPPKQAPQRFHEPEPRKIVFGGKSSRLMNQEMEQPKPPAPDQEDEPMINQQSKYDNKKQLKKEIRKNKVNETRQEDRQNQRSQNTSQAQSTKGQAEMVSTTSETQQLVQTKHKKHQQVGFNEIKLLTMLIHF